MTVLVRTVARLVLLPIFMVAAALLVRAYHGPGDGFSAGVAAAVGVLLQYVVFGHQEAVRRMRLLPAGPLAGIGGLMLMLGVALRGPLTGDALLSHVPPAGAEVVTVGGVELHTAVLFDFGIAVLVFGVLVSLLEMFSGLAREGAR